MSSAEAAKAEPIDFDAAETFLKVARQAQQDGDEVQCFAARKLVAIALHLTEGPRASRLHTEHLRTA